jgi:hypothetical protein
MTQADATSCRGRARVIAINTTYELAPWADVLYACDAKWWKWYPAASAFQGLKYTLSQPQVKVPDLHVLQNTGRDGLELKPTGLKTGCNSGYQAVNLAVHLGAARIILLGYDMQPHGGRHHHHPEHPQKSTPPYAVWVCHFATLAAALKKHGIDVVNCSRRTALTCFPKDSLAHALPATNQEAA